MTTRTEDRLLAVTRWGLLAATWLTALVAVGAFLAIPALYSQRFGHGRELLANHFPSIAAMLALLGVALVLAVLFLRHLRRIVDSVAQGEAFAPANAERLKRMGWLTVAYQIVQVPLSGLIIWFDSAPARSNVHYGDESVSPALIALALILFILARVFREGAAMREDLEGTV